MASTAKAASMARLDRVRSRLIRHGRFHAVLQSLSLAVIALLTLSSGTLAVHAVISSSTGFLVPAGALLLLVRFPSLLGVVVAICLGLMPG